MYDTTKEKISEVYETKLRYRAFYFGLALAFTINADFFSLYTNLSKNSIIREEIVARSDVINSQIALLTNQIEMDDTKPISDFDQEIKEVKNKIEDLTSSITDAGLRLGWTRKEFGELGVLSGMYKLIGLFLSGLLVSFGAPFWHDFIGTFTGLKKTLQKTGNTS
jgi:hypothetical protein